MRLDQMPPGYFALVMSTGIVSLACHLMGFAFLALVLFWMNLSGIAQVLAENVLSCYHQRGLTGLLLPNLLFLDPRQRG